MSRKRVISLLMAVALICASLIGCGNGNAGGDASSQSSQSSEGVSNDEKLKIAFIPQLIGIPYFSAMEEGGKKRQKN